MGKFGAFCTILASYLAHFVNAMTHLQKEAFIGLLCTASIFFKMTSGFTGNILPLHWPGQDVPVSLISRVREIKSASGDGGVSWFREIMKIAGRSGGCLHYLSV